ncbi:MAG: PqqD family protein [Oscillospiraceae bacterium]|nr:PqqD family protein [Oscillospiraceae bacterium]
MKVKGNYALRQVAKTWVVMPLGQATLDLDGILTLNETGALLWKTLEQGGDREAMIRALTGEYDVSPERAGADVDRFLGKLADAGVLEE